MILNKNRLKIFLIIVIALCAGFHPNLSSGAVAGETTLPAERSFYMGFSPQPHDLSESAWEEAFHNGNIHGDIIVNYFDEGVPWPEAHENANAYHPNLEADIQRRLKHLNKGKKSLLALSPLDLERRSPAGYRGEEDWMERPGDWKNRKFNHDKMITAYLNYCRNMIHRFKPDYMVYACEVDDAFTNPEDPEFQEFLFFIKTVHKTLRKEYPGLLLIMEFVLYDRQSMKKREKVTRLFLPYTDIYAVSTYPYLVDGIGGDIENLPVDWFARVAANTNKPFAIMETGWLAESYTLYRIPIVSGDEKWQTEYVRFILEEANKLNAEYVVWWVSRDYDALWKKMKKAGFPDEFKIWKDTGLMDGNGKPRPGLSIWDTWLKLPKR